MLFLYSFSSCNIPGCSIIHPRFLSGSELFLKQNTRSCDIIHFLKIEFDIRNQDGKREGGGEGEREKGLEGKNGSIWREGGREGERKETGRKRGRKEVWEGKKEVLGEEGEKGEEMGKEGRKQGGREGGKERSRESGSGVDTKRRRKDGNIDGQNPCFYDKKMKKIRRKNEG